MKKKKKVNFPSLGVIFSKKKKIDEEYRVIYNYFNSNNSCVY